MLPTRLACHHFPHRSPTAGSGRTAPNARRSGVTPCPPNIPEPARTTARRTATSDTRSPERPERQPRPRQHFPKVRHRKSSRRAVAHTHRGRPINRGPRVRSSHRTATTEVERCRRGFYGGVGGSGIYFPPGAIRRSRICVRRSTSWPSDEGSPAVQSIDTPEPTPEIPGTTSSTQETGTMRIEAERRDDGVVLARGPRGGRPAVGAGPAHVAPGGTRRTRPPRPRSRRCGLPRLRRTVRTRRARGEVGRWPAELGDRRGEPGGAAAPRGHGTRRADAPARRRRQRGEGRPPLSRSGRTGRNRPPFQPVTRVDVSSRT